MTGTPTCTIHEGSLVEVVGDVPEAFPAGELPDQRSEGLTPTIE